MLTLGRLGLGPDTSSMLRALAFGFFLLTPLAAAQSPSEVVPLPEAPRSVELSGFTVDAPDGWRIIRHRGGERPQALLQQVPIGGPEIVALTLSIPAWDDRHAAASMVMSDFELVPLDSAWTDRVVGTDSVTVRAFSAPPEAPAATAAVAAVESRGRVAVVFLSTETPWEADRLRETALTVAAGLRRHAEASAD